MYYRKQIRKAEIAIEVLLDRKQRLELRKRTLIEFINYNDIIQNDYKQAVILLQQVSTICRESIKNIFSSKVTEAISIVTDIDAKFGLDIEVKRDDLEAYFTIDGERDFVDARGGGLLDIVAIMLRVIFLTLLKSDIPLILDEPTKFLHSSSYSRQIGAFLRKIAKNRQVIISTNAPELAESGDKVIRTKMIHGISSVTNIIRDEK